jgi:hypothetical protein
VGGTVGFVSAVGQISYTEGILPVTAPRGPKARRMDASGAARIPLRLEKFSESGWKAVTGLDLLAGRRVLEGLLCLPVPSLFAFQCRGTAMPALALDPCYECDGKISVSSMRIRALQLEPGGPTWPGQEGLFLHVGLAPPPGQKKAPGFEGDIEVPRCMCFILRLKIRESISERFDNIKHPRICRS